MMIKKCSGRRGIILLASVVVCSLYINTAHAWQQEYIVDNTPGYTTERYTWDSDHQPRYDDILAERIRTTQTVPGLAVNLEQASPTEATSGMSMGWNFPVSGDVTTGQWRRCITMAPPPPFITNLAIAWSANRPIRYGMPASARWAGG